MEKQNTATTPEVVSYEKDKIQLLFNILNSVNFTGFQQAQAVLPIAGILGEPIATSNNKESGD